jgi:ABC-type Mn2+/Zn2+ transport system ATPase subunit
MSTRTPALRLAHVSVRMGERLALKDISFDVKVGSFVGLIGPNGSGKSTLLRSVLGVLPLTTGRVEVEGRVPEESREAFAYLPQRQRLELDLPLRAWDVAMMGRLRHTGWLRPAGKQDKDRVTWALERVGMLERRNSAVGELSFGQQQRVLFARALAQEGRILLLDEPMNGVDPKTQELFLELLAGFHAEGKTILMATHDLNQAAEVCDSVCVLNQRLVAYGPLRQTLTEDVLRDAYGVHLHFMGGGPEGAHVLEDVHHHETSLEHAEGHSDRLD